MRDAKKTKEAIGAAALALFAGKGVEATSIRDIAQATGLSEGALYRHFPSKDMLAREMFLTAYAALAHDVLAAGRGARLSEAVPRVIEVFCRLFDDNRDLFAFLLLQQHAYLAAAPPDPEGNVVEAVRTLIVDGLASGEIATDSPDRLTAMALGVVMQPAVFVLYGRLPGPLLDHADAMTEAVRRLAAR